MVIEVPEKPTPRRIQLAKRSIASDFHKFMPEFEKVSYVESFKNRRLPLSQTKQARPERTVISSPTCRILHLSLQKPKRKTSVPVSYIRISCSRSTQRYDGFLLCRLRVNENLFEDSSTSRLCLIGLEMQGSSFLRTFVTLTLFSLPDFAACR